MMKLDPYWFNNDEEFWIDIKCEDVIFPSHNEDMNGEVTVWNINDK